MSQTTCSGDGCERTDRIARGMCSLHYQRWKRSGDPAPRGARDLTPWERFWRKVDADADCWVWTAGKTADGYGRFRVSPGVRVLAHRWSYEALVGTVPSGYQVDHLCKNESCVNPDHLEPVPPVVNVRRSSAGWNSRAKVRCPQGHPYEGRNVQYSGGRRHCRICSLAAGRAMYARKRKARQALIDRENR